MNKTETTNKRRAFTDEDRELLRPYIGFGILNYNKNNNPFAKPRKLFYYDENKTYVDKIGNMLTRADIAKDVPGIGVTGLDYAVISDEEGNVIYGIGSLVALRDHFDIDTSMSDEEAMLAIANIINESILNEETDSLTIYHSCSEVNCNG